MMRKPEFLVIVVVAWVVTGCASGTETHRTPDRAGIERYEDLYQDRHEEPWQAASAPYAVPPGEADTGTRAPGSAAATAEERLEQADRDWHGRFVLREFKPVVNPDLLRLKQIYMGADQRVHRSELVPPPEGGITTTRVAVHQEKEGSDWVILNDRDPEYRMFQVIRWFEIVRALSWAGAEHVLLGTVSFGGVTFESDPAFPLHFKIVQDVGYVYLCGRGTVTTPDGERYSLGREGSFSRFLHDLTAENQMDREAASEALGRLARTQGQKDKAVPALVSALKDDAMEVRRNAAASLDKIGDSRALEGLRAALAAETDEWVREVMAHAVKMIQDE